jgi:hypothetical protein
MHRGMPLLIAVGLLTTTCVAGSVRDTRRQDDARRIQVGMTAKEAEAILGKPSWRGTCGARMGSTDCASELGYTSSFAPLLPAYLIVRLNQNGRVIAVDKLTSP